MFIVNLFGFVMISSTILFGVLFYNKACAIEKEIHDEIMAESGHDDEETKAENESDDRLDITETDDDTNLHTNDDADQEAEEDLIV